ncbi:MAG: T9SS type A sorting domain-containing protein [Bacteroidales bacterium]|nr:T9SS type A sorting domain-containing protein [Bacteroidales bacterium]
MKQLSLFSLLLYSVLVYSQNTHTVVQTDWSRGWGQEYLTNSTGFFVHYGIDFSSSPGEITMNNTTKNSMGVPFEFKGRIFTSTVNGLMAFDTLAKTWDFLTPNIYYLDHAILRDTLYVMGIRKIYAYDGSTNDYGLGPNGFWFHSNTPESYIFCIDAVGDYLYFGGRLGSSGSAYRYNPTSEVWEKMGSNFTQGVYCFEEYNGTLFVGTHWSGGIYAWNGSTWAYVYGMGLMTVYDLQIFNGKLYACGITTSHNTGKIVEYDGTSWTTIYSGHGVRYMTVHDNKLYFSAHKATPPGAVYAYDGTSSTQIYTLENEAFPVGLLSLNDELYYGGVEHVYGGTNNSKLYKSGNTFYELYVSYLNSSTITATTGDWGFLSSDKTEPSNTGVKMYVMGRDNTEEWGVNREFIYTPNNAQIQSTDTELRYQAVLWTADPSETPSLQEVRLQASISLGTSELEKTFEFNLFPNPSNGLIQIERNSSLSDDFSIEVYNYVGKLMFSKEIQHSNLLELDLSNLPNGLYLIRFKQKDKQITQKLEIAKR